MDLINLGLWVSQGCINLGTNTPTHLGLIIESFWVISSERHIDSSLGDIMTNLDQFND